MDIILYGSFARNSAGKDSDIDIAVVLRGEVDTVKEIRSEISIFQPVSKITFSCFASEKFCTHLRPLKKKP